MQKFRDILCIEIPPLIRLELKDRYASWYSRSDFHSQMTSPDPSHSLLICPAEFFISSENRWHLKIIAFGTSSLLENSFIHGADDYLKNPWTCEELVIRSSRLLSRYQIILKGECLGFNGHIFQLGPTPIPLTPVQTLLLTRLIDFPNEFISCKDLSRLPNQGVCMSRETLYVQISGIRKVLKNVLPEIYGNELSIMNSQGRGYMLSVAVDNLCKTVDKL